MKQKVRQICLSIFLVIANGALISGGFLLSFVIRYGTSFHDLSYAAFKKSFPFLLVIYLGSLLFFKVYKYRFQSSWELFKRVTLGMFWGTLLSIVAVYVFRQLWSGFPSSIFVISFFVNTGLIFIFNRNILKTLKRIKKKVMIFGDGDIDEIVAKKSEVERKKIHEIGELVKYTDIDEIVISEEIKDEKHLNLLVYSIQKLKVNVVFSPAVYMNLLPGRINGEETIHFFSTFFGKKRDIEEFLIRALDIIGCIFIILFAMPVIILILLVIWITSPGNIFYKQKRVGKDGKLFYLYKFRTMVKNAEGLLGPIMASKDDPRATKVGKFLRKTRLDELAQLFNVLKGDMSLVGPRPERPHFIKLYKILGEMRLAVKPGVTGLAQVRGFYDLHPRHKIKYDYLYIQRRSLLLNLSILLKTIPVVLLRKGW